MTFVLETRAEMKTKKTRRNLITAEIKIIPRKDGKRLADRKRRQICRLWNFNNE